MSPIPQPEAPAPEAAFAAIKPQVTASILRALGGFKLTLSLFAALGLFAAIGSFIPQGDEAPRIIQIYGQKAYDLAIQLGLDQIYRSWWFVMVLALMAVNLIMVTWVRVPHVWRLSREADAKLFTDPLVPKTAFTRAWDTELPALESQDIARQVLQKQFPRLAQQSGPSKRVLVGEKHFISLWSAHIVHLGLLLLLLGGVLKILFGSGHDVVIKEGEQASVAVDKVNWGFFYTQVPIPGTSLSLPLPQLYHRSQGKAGFELYLDHFEVRYYPGSAAPSLFRSDLKILRDGQIDGEASVKVNDPLELDGVMLYQASWGYEGLRTASFEVSLPGQKDKLDVHAPYKQKVKLLDTGWELQVEDFLPDAQMEGPGKLVNGSDELRNPAIHVRFWQRGVEKAFTWFVYAVPDIQMTKVPGLKLVGKTVDPIPFTVLQANVDPGVDLAALGAVLVLLGVFTAFYLFYRKAWVLVEPLPGGGSRVTLAGFVRRNKAGFRSVFERLEKDLDQGLQGGGDRHKEQA